MILQTPRLILRGPRPDDLDAYFAIHAAPGAMKYWSTLPHTSPNETREKLDRFIAGFADQPTCFMMEQNGRIIGSIGVAVGNEIGFILHPDHHRKGFASEALRAILPHVWDTTDYDHLVADVDPRNEASIGLLTSFGFFETHRKSGTFQIGADWVDSVYFRLNRPA